LIPPVNTIYMEYEQLLHKYIQVDMKYFIFWQNLYIL